MPIHQALYSGVTGLNSNSDGMAVIANNIANANTRSFKSDRAEFEDLLVVSLNEASQLGRGSRLRNITTSWEQGALTPTGGLLDMGVQGDGFFIIRNDNMEVKESNGVFFTRQGSFRFNKEGYIVDPSGGKVQGYTADKEGKLASRLGDLQITTSNIPPSASSRVTIAVNLDVRERPPNEEFDVHKPNQTSNHSTTVTIFDNMGMAHLTTLYFAKQEGDGNNWKWWATVDGSEAGKGGERDREGHWLPAIVAQGNLEFDTDGKPIMHYRTKDGKSTYIDTLEKKDAHEILFGNGALPQKLQFNFGPAEDENGNINTQSSTSIASRSTTLFHSQNGYEAGQLKTLKIDLDGSLRGVYTNGLERRLGAVALASFVNNHGLEKSGRNMYIAPPKAGEPRIGQAGTGVRGSVYANSLEESNVDIAQQFVNMITTQRAFQANSKSITTTDSMLEEVLNLKR